MRKIIEKVNEAVNKFDGIGAHDELLDYWKNDKGDSDVMLEAAAELILMQEFEYANALIDAYELSRKMGQRRPFLVFALKTYMFSTIKEIHAEENNWKTKIKKIFYQKRGCKVWQNYYTPLQKWPRF